MKAAQVVVWEAAGQWAAELRRRARLGGGESAPRLVEVVRWADCEPRLRQFPCSCLIVELRRDNVEQVLAALWELRRRYPQVVPVVVAETGLAPYHGLAQELGAAAVVDSWRRLDVVGHVARRVLAAAPDLPLDLLDRIWAELPWSDGLPPAQPA